jgi:hypothetical protein
MAEDGIVITIQDVDGPHRLRVKSGTTRQEAIRLYQDYKSASAKQQERAFGTPTGISAERMYRLPIYTPSGPAVIPQSTVRSGIEAVPYAAGIGGAALGMGVGGPLGALAGAYIGGAGGGAAEQLLKRAVGLRDVPQTGMEAARGIVGSAETQTGLEALGQVGGLAVRRFPTVGKRIAGAEKMKSAIGKMAEEVSPEKETAVDAARKALRERRAGIQQQITTAREQVSQASEQLKITREAEKQAEKSATERFMREAGAAPKVGDSLSDYALGSDIKRQAYRQQVRIPKLIEKKGYTELETLADSAGLSVKLSESTKAARKILDPQALAMMTGTSPIARPVTSAAERTIQVAAELEKQRVPANIAEAVSQKAFGWGYQSLSEPERAAVRKMLESSKLAVPGGGYVPVIRPEAGFAFKEARQVLAGVNRQIDGLFRAGQRVEGNPTLNALVQYKQGLEKDISESLAGRPELQELYNSMKSVTVERKGFQRTRLGAGITRPIAEGGMSAEAVARSLRGPSPETATKAIAQGLERGSASEAALHRFESDATLKRVAQRADSLAARTQGNIGRSAVHRVVFAGTRDRTLEGVAFDAGKSLDYLESNPALRKQMGEQAYAELQQSLSEQVQKQLEFKAKIDISEIEQAKAATGVAEAQAQSARQGLEQTRERLSEQSAQFLASDYGKFLRAVAGTSNPNSALDMIANNPVMAQQAASTLTNPSQRDALSRAIVDRLVEKSSRAKVFNASEFSNRYVQARSSLQLLTSPEKFSTLNKFSDAVNTLSQGIAFKTGQSVGISENLIDAGPTRFRLWGLAPMITEFLTGKPQSYLAIRPVHIMKISRDPQLAELLGEAVNTARNSPRARAISFSLGYALSRLTQEDENQ